MACTRRVRKETPTTINGKRVFKKLEAVSTHRRPLEIGKSARGLLSLDTIADIVNLPYWTCTAANIHLPLTSPNQSGGRENICSTELDDRHCTGETRTTACDPKAGSDR